MKNNNAKIKTAIFTILIIALPLLNINSCGTDKEIRNLGIFSPSRTEIIAGQDGCTPIKFDRNTIIWTFGDTIIGSWKDTVSVNTTFELSAAMKGILSNSLAFSENPVKGNISRINLKFYKQNGNVAQFIKFQNDENPHKLRLWPLDGIRIKDTVYVYYVIISIDQKAGDIPIKIRGMGIASWEVPKGWTTKNKINFKRMDSLLTGDVPTFGDSVIEKDGFLYLSGHKKYSDGLVSACFARVRAENISRVSKYQFLGKDGAWASDITQCGRFFDDVAGELSLSFNSFLNKYIILYCSINGKIKSVSFDTFNVLSTKNAAEIYTPPPLPEIKSRPFLFYYSGKEIFATEKNIYAIYINPAIYQPILLEIPNELLK